MRRPGPRRAIAGQALRLLALASLSTAGWLLGGQLWIAAKARVAHGLIDRAFAAHLTDGATHVPWSWADTHPIARLELPRQGIRRTILSGASGSSLAFGPGHLDGTARPGEPGNSVIVGHRDSWFAFLQQVRVGDPVRLQTWAGTTEFRVTKLLVVAEDELSVLGASIGRRLTLLTCYPFGGIRRTRLRFAVICDPIA